MLEETPAGLDDLKNTDEELVKASRQEQLPVGQS